MGTEQSLAFAFRAVKHRLGGSHVEITLESASRNGIGVVGLRILEGKPKAFEISRVSNLCLYANVRYFHSLLYGYCKRDIYSSVYNGRDIDNDCKS